MRSVSRFGLVVSVAFMVFVPALLEAHTVQICFRNEPGGGVTFFAGTYHFPGTPVGGLIVNGITYPFTGITDPLPGNITGCQAVSFCSSGFDEAGVNWQTVTVLGLTPGSQSVTTTCTDAIECPWPSCYPTTLTTGGGGAAGCPPHTVHGHISTVPPSHSGVVSHEHHGQHAHTVAAGCPPHAPGHSAGLFPEQEQVFGGLTVGAQRTDSWAAVNQDGSPNGLGLTSQEPPNGGSRPARRGSVLQLFGSAAGLYLDDRPVVDGREVFTPPASGSPLYYTTRLARVQIAGMPAKVLFSGLAPGLPGVWQINIELPEESPAGPVPVTISYEGLPVSVIDVFVE